MTYGDNVGTENRDEIWTQQVQERKQLRPGVGRLPGHAESGILGVRPPVEDADSRSDRSRTSS